MKIDSPRTAALRSLRNDGFLLGGLGLLTYGAWLVFEPAGFIVPGIFLLAIGVLGARR